MEPKVSRLRFALLRRSKASLREIVPQNREGKVGIGVRSEGGRKHDKPHCHAALRYLRSTNVSIQTVRTATAYWSMADAPTILLISIATVTLGRDFLPSNSIEKNEVFQNPELSIETNPVSLRQSV